jgi:hypothetical protein
MKTMNKIILGAVAGFIGVAVASSALAAPDKHSLMGWGRDMHPGVVGTVASVSGTAIIVTSTQPHATTPTTFTIDASKATVTKNNAPSSVSAIVVGDTVAVAGTVNGTTVTATKIIDGAIMDKKKGKNLIDELAHIKGNGQPIIAGTVSAVNGNSITISNGGGATYAINVSTAKVVKLGVANAIASSIAVGDMVVVQGAVNGSAVTASTVIDRTSMPKASANSGMSPGHGQQHGIFGFMKHLFGF